jgi:arylsulfatase A-like enzyme
MQAESADGRSKTKAEKEPPNVVFIIGDDLNDLPLRPEGRQLVPTPNMDRLAARGVSFRNAHSNDPLCAPSRSSMLFGLYPQTTGLYWFEDWRRNPIHTNSVSLLRHLRDNGYDVYVTGKIFHGQENDPVHRERGFEGNFGPWPWDGKAEWYMLPHPQQQYLFESDGDMPYQWEHCFGSLNEVPDWPADKAAGIPGYRGWRLFNQAWNIEPDGTRDRLPDELSAQWSAEVIGRKHERPFALFTGFVRTHTPLYAPQDYFDRFPLDSIELPKVLEGDVEDCAKALTDPELYGFRRFNMLQKHDDRQLYRKWLQAYMACVSFVDDQVGTVLDALEQSPYREDTVIILTSDHGFHMGEKGFLYKQSLWDGATRVPLIVAGAKGMAQGEVCDRPVSLIDVYPTLADLCGLPADPNRGKSGYQLDGYSLRPLLDDPAGGAWKGPEVAVTALPGEDHMWIAKGMTEFAEPHFSVRSEHWRYTLCSSGEEELYDYRADPFEWHNLAASPEHAAVKEKLKKQLLELKKGQVRE